MKKCFAWANVVIPILAGSLFYYITSPDVIFVKNIEQACMSGWRIHL